MTIPASRRRGTSRGAKRAIVEAMDMPEQDGKCAFAGGYVDDGQTVCWFGDEYICRAPNLQPTGKRC